MRALLILTALVAGIPLLGQKQLVPVQVNPRLNAASPAEAGQRLNAALTEGAARPDGVRNCTELLAAAASMEIGGGPDAQARQSTLADCRVLQALSLAGPSKSSHVSELKWDEKVLPLLPAELAINVSQEALGKAKGKLWTALDKGLSASAPAPGEIVVKGSAFTERLILCGRGDFNKDGRQDLLVQTLDTLTQGTYRNTRVFILTRKSDAGRLTVVRQLQ